MTLKEIARQALYITIGVVILCAVLIVIGIKLLSDVVQ